MKTHNSVGSLSFSLSPLNNNRTLWTVKDTLTDEMK